MKSYNWFVRLRSSAGRAIHPRNFVCCVARKYQDMSAVLFCSHAFLFYNHSLSIPLCIYCCSLYIVEWPNDTAETFNIITGKENVWAIRLIHFINCIQGTKKPESCLVARHCKANAKVYNRLTSLIVQALKKGWWRSLEGVQKKRVKSPCVHRDGNKTELSPKRELRVVLSHRANKKTTKSDIRVFFTTIHFASVV